MEVGILSIFQNYQGRSDDAQMVRNERLVRELEMRAARLECTAAQLSLAWLLAKSPHIVPIPGTKRRAYLEQSAAATAIELSPDDVAGLDAVFREDAAVGARYPEDMMRMLDSSH